MAKSIFNQKHFLLYLITDSSLFPTEKKFLYCLKKNILSGVDFIQLREKHLNTLQLYNLAVKIKKLTENTKTRLLINDRIDIALASKADGVHLGWNSLSPDLARKLLGKNKIIGKSFHSIKEVENCSDTLDYVIFSPIFSTPSKEGLIKTIGIKKLQNAVNISNHPLIALGGINKSNIKEVINTGISGAGFIRAGLEIESLVNHMNNASI